VLFGMHADDSWLRLVPGLVVARHRQRRAERRAAPPRRCQRARPTRLDGPGANNTARYSGSSLGVAVTVVAPATSDSGPEEAMAAGVNHAALIAAALCLLGALVAVWGRIAENRTARAAASRRTRCRSGAPVKPCGSDRRRRHPGATIPTFP
jgi:hypothetical protein